MSERIETIDIENLKGHIHFAILTIREDEFEAVLEKFSPSSPVIGGKQFYEYCQFNNSSGDSLNIVVARFFDQGHSPAQSVTRDIIEDLSPKWLILTGIAGGIPHVEFTLGDVMLAINLLDFSVSAAIEEKSPGYRVGGGQMHRDVEKLLAVLPAWRNRLIEWNTEKAIGRKTPPITIPSDIHADVFYGSPDFRSKVQSSLKKHFPKDDLCRLPQFRSDSLATGNTLIKDTNLLKRWQEVARHLSHVEMEAGGVYQAARHGGEQEIPFLCARGLSDIIGFERSSLDKATNIL